MEHHPMHQKVAGSVLGKGTYLGCRFNPWLGYVLEATGACFSLTLMFLSLSLKSINISLVKIVKKSRNSKIMSLNIVDLVLKFWFIFC